MTSRWIASYDKDPSAELDYAIDWSSWLSSGETISASSWSTGGLVDMGLASIVGGKAIVWLSGGATGTRYLVENLITTSEGRTDQRTIQIVCVER